MIGLFFFIRASAKDRTKEIKLIIEQSEESLVQHLQQYFTQRAYQVTAVDPTQKQITFQGFVSPSWFMAIFLSCLAALGLLCLTLVLSLLYPSLSALFLALTLFSPIAGIFYWYKAGRLEQVLLKVESLKEHEGKEKCLVTVTAHRDELIHLQGSLPIKLVS